MARTKCVRLRKPSVGTTMTRKWNHQQRENREKRCGVGSTFGRSGVSVPSRDSWSPMLQPPPPPLQEGLRLTPSEILSVPTEGTPQSVSTGHSRCCCGASRRRSWGMLSWLLRGHSPAAPSVRQIVPICTQDIAAVAATSVLRPIHVALSVLGSRQQSNSATTSHEEHQLATERPKNGSFRRCTLLSHATPSTTCSCRSCQAHTTPR